MPNNAPSIGRCLSMFVYQSDFPRFAVTLVAPTATPLDHRVLTCMEQLLVDATLAELLPRLGSSPSESDTEKMATDGDEARGNRVDGIRNRHFSVCKISMSPSKVWM